MKKVKKAVIPAAGLGTRFLPATKTVPKEMLTIVDQPILLYIVEEAVKSGIEDIVLVAGRNKHAIDDFFDVSYELEDFLKKRNQSKLLDRITAIQDMANIVCIRQKQALGLGHAIHCAKPILGDDPFAVLLGDEIMIGEGKNTVTGDLIKNFVNSGESSVSIMQVEKEDVVKYGIISGKEISARTWQIKDIVEKPSITSAPSQWALPGRYVFSKKILSALENLAPGKNGEIQLTDGMVTVAKTEGMQGIVLNADRYDAGDKLGFLKANIEIGLRHPELKSSLKKYLKELTKHI